MYWLYQKLSDKHDDVVAIHSGNTAAELIKEAENITRQWAEVGITRHFCVSYFANRVWEN